MDLADVFLSVDPAFVDLFQSAFFFCLDELSKGIAGGCIHLFHSVDVFGVAVSIDFKLVIGCW